MSEEEVAAVVTFGNAAIKTNTRRMQRYNERCIAKVLVRGRGMGVVEGGNKTKAGEVVRYGM